MGIIRRTICKIQIVTILIFFAFPSSFFAFDSAALPHGEKLIENIYSEKEKDFSALVVEKSSNNIYLIHVKDNIPSVVKNYEVITGKNNGDKKKVGDEKTPEGIYFVTGYIPGDKLKDPLYGIGAFPINYPNIVDTIKGKTGSGIWIHGRDNFDNGNKTRGCVSLKNADFKDLQKNISLGIPVVISEKTRFVAPDNYSEQRTRYFDYLMRFISAWEGGDFRAFSEFFHEEFRNATGLSSAPYLLKKKKLMELYPKRKVNISEITILKENSSELVYAFNQFYCAPNMATFGRKLLYVEQGEEEMPKIIAEEFFNRSPHNYLKRSIKEFVGQWKETWVSQNIQEYLRFYDDAFANGKMDLHGWKEYKENLFMKSQLLDIKVKNMRIQMLAPQRIKVTFVQEYSSGSYKDKGIKTLILTGCPDTHTILSETWRPL